jgi:hypothetical protein
LQLADFTDPPSLHAVIPAQAGIHFMFATATWIPACAGMTIKPSQIECLT